jgi:hypothetical protein
MRNTVGFRDYSMALNNSIRYLHLVAILCLGAAMGLAGAALGLTRTEIYQATVPAPSRSDSVHAAAFQAAMKIVLVRVTGRRTAGEDTALEPLVSGAGRYVQQYRDAPDGKLWVAFDGAAIERWLTQNGQPLWGRERPSTFVWLAVQTGPQTGTVVTADDTSELKAAIDAAATARGIPLIWPSAADVQRSQLDYATLMAKDAGSLADAAHHLGADGVLIGHANGPTTAANVRWTELFQDRSSEFSGALEGVNRIADAYAAIFAASGALAPIDIQVSGIDNLQDYAAVQTYLESMTFIAHVGVQELAGDTVTFRLSTRGGADSLQHALALNGRLQSLPAGDNGIQRFQLHR